MYCTRCKKESIINLPYNGVNLCKDCFIEYFEKRARATIRKFDQIDVGDRIAVGLSGGKDSSSLLYFLKKFSEKRRFEILAITIDVGIKEYGDSTMNNAKFVCEKLRIQHNVYSFKNNIGMTMDDIYEKISNKRSKGSQKSQKTKEGQKVTRLCTHCGVLRRDLLNKKAKELKCDKLAIAHNLEDEDQTFLMNIVRGDIEKIIWGGGLIKDKRLVPRIKPFITSPEVEIKMYAKINFPDLNFEHICPYRKDAYRNTFKEILNLLNKRHPGSNFQIYESSQKLRNILLKDYKIECANFCKICGNLCNTNICKRCELLEKLKSCV